MAPKDNDPITKKSWVIYSKNVTVWNVMKNALKSSKEHLGRGVKSI